MIVGSASIGSGFPEGKAVFSAAPVTTRSGRIKQESYGEKKDAVQIQEVNEEQETFNNPWNISVKPDSYQATFSWEDSSISLVSVRLENEDG